MLLILFYTHNFTTIVGFGRYTTTRPRNHATTRLITQSHNHKTTNSQNPQTTNNHNSQEKVRAAAYECLIQIASSYYQFLGESIAMIFDLTKHAMAKESDEVTPSAIEIWYFYEVLLAYD